MRKIIITTCICLLCTNFIYSQTSYHLYPNVATPYLWINNKYLICDSKYNYDVYEVKHTANLVQGVYTTLVKYGSIRKRKIESLKRRYGLKLPVYLEGFTNEKDAFDEVVYHLSYQNIFASPGDTLYVRMGGIAIHFKDSIRVQILDAPK